MRMGANMLASHKHNVLSQRSKQAADSHTRPFTAVEAPTGQERPIDSTEDAAHAQHADYVTTAEAVSAGKCETTGTSTPRVVQATTKGVDRGSRDGESRAVDSMHLEATLRPTDTAVGQVQQGFQGTSVCVASDSGAETPGSPASPPFPELSTGCRKGLGLQVPSDRWDGWSNPQVRLPSSQLLSIALLRRNICVRPVVAFRLCKKRYSWDLHTVTILLQ